MPGARAAKRTLIILVTVSALAAAVSGCGDTVKVGSGRIVKVVLSEYRVMPQRLSASSGELTLEVYNEGRLTHNLVVSSLGTVQGETTPIPPGEAVIMTLVLAPGRYTMASTLFSDEALGTYGTIVVSS